MRVRLIVAMVFGALISLLENGIGPASAEPCPDVEVVFARATGERPGVGGVGQSFVDAVRSLAGGRSVAAYGVNYPASADFEDLAGFRTTVTDGVRDDAFRVQFMAETCPQTRLILGGYSQGAAVTAITTSAMTPAAATNVAAVVLFGKPTGDFVPKYDVPAIDVGPVLGDRALELCALADSVCDGVVTGEPSVAHTSYTGNGMAAEGAAFAVSKL